MGTVVTKQVQSSVFLSVWNLELGGIVEFRVPCSKAQALQANGG